MFLSFLLYRYIVKERNRQSANFYDSVTFSFFVLDSNDILKKKREKELRTTRKVYVEFYNCLSLVY